MNAFPDPDHIEAEAFSPLGVAPLVIDRLGDRRACGLDAFDILLTIAPHTPTLLVALPTSRRP